jgi:hypothetical protein
MNPYTAAALEMLADEDDADILPLQITEPVSKGELVLAATANSQKHLTDEQWTAYIYAPETDPVRAIGERGKRIKERRDAYPETRGGDQSDKSCVRNLPFGEFCKVHLKISEGYARMLIRVSEWLQSVDSVNAMLPASVRTLYELTRLTDDQFNAATKSGAIHQEMTRDEALQLRGGETKKPTSLPAPGPTKPTATPDPVIDMDEGTGFWKVDDDEDEERRPPTEGFTNSPSRAPAAKPDPKRDLADILAGVKYNPNIDPDKVINTATGKGVGWKMPEEAKWTGLVAFIYQVLDGDLPQDLSQTKTNLRHVTQDHITDLMSFLERIKQQLPATLGTDHQEHTTGISEPASSTLPETVNPSTHRQAEAVKGRVKLTADDIRPYCRRESHAVS